MIGSYTQPHSNAKKISVRTDTASIRVLVLTLALTGNLLPGVGGLSLAVVGLAISVVFAIYDIVRYLPIVHPVLTYVIPLFMLLSISYLWTDAPGDYGTQKLTKLLTSTLLTALIALVIRDESDLSALAVVWPIVMLPIAFVSLTAFEGGRATGFDSNPIWVARALSTGLIFITWRMWSGRERPTYLVSLTVPLLLVGALILTGSRGPIAGLIVGILVLGLFSARGRLARIYMAVIGATFLAGILFFTDIFSRSRLVESVKEGRLFDSSGRDKLIPVAVDVIREYPWGVGIGNISDYWTARFEYPHNIFIEVAAEHGLLVGTIFLLVTLITFVRLALAAAKDQYALLLTALLACEIIYVSVSGDLNARTFFFVLVLSIWLLHRRAKHLQLITQERLNLGNA